MKRDFNIWEGVFGSFEEARTEAKGSGFGGDIYRNKVKSVTQECIDALASGNPIPPFHKQRSTMLPPVAGILLDRKERIRVFDLGGGLGIGYLVLQESIPDAKTRIDYHITEVAEVCELSKEIFRNNEIAYSENLPEGSFDIVHSASAMQYIEDWKGMLKKLSGYGAEYILLSDVFAGNNPTFATLQTYYDSRIPHWFLNLGELLAEMQLCGYSLSMKSFVTSKRLAAEDDLPMENFDETHRLKQTLHLLFHRNK